MTVILKLREDEYQFVLDTLDAAREEFATLIHDEEWYVTELDERCEAAHTIMKYAEKLTNEIPQE